jgi:hypothetical protein
MSQSNLQLLFQGSLVCGPAGSGEGGVPGGSTVIPYQTNPNPKCLAVSTGDMVAQVSSPGSYQQLRGVGDNVTQATFLAMLTTAAMSVRVTTYNPAGNVQAVEVINGLKVSEFDPGAYLVKLEVMGTGTVEFFAGGPQ